MKDDHGRGSKNSNIDVLVNSNAFSVNASLGNRTLYGVELRTGSDIDRWYD